MSLKSVIDELQPTRPARSGSLAAAGAHRRHRALLRGAVAAAALLPGLEQQEGRARRSASSRSSKLRDEFRDKHAKAVNLELYKQQLEDIERSFGAMLRQLPGKTEVPNLLVDISQTGLAAGLQQQLFQPQPEQNKDFYAELPIKIRLTGSYHQMGEFVSGIAALPRIVTLHDVEIKPVTKDGLRPAAAGRDGQDLPLPRRGRDRRGRGRARKPSAATTRGSSSS